jgi:hypothetical protein
MTATLSESHDAPSRPAQVLESAAGADGFRIR